MGYLFILGTIAFTVYAQLILKWQMSQIKIPTPEPVAMAAFVAGLLIRPWIVSCFVAAFLAFLCWSAALQRFELSYAYPFMGASFVLVLWLSSLLLQEPIGWQKLTGTLLIVAGIFLSSRS